MSNRVEADDRGRILIPHDIREEHGDQYRVVDLNDRVVLIPINDDPIEGLRDAVDDAFDDTSIDEIKRETCEGR